MRQSHVFFTSPKRHYLTSYLDPPLGPYISWAGHNLKGRNAVDIWHPKDIRKPLLLRPYIGRPDLSDLGPYKDDLLWDVLFIARIFLFEYQNNFMNECHISIHIKEYNIHSSDISYIRMWNRNISCYEWSTFGLFRGAS